MRGKDKCRILKQIRQQIADANDIEYITRECTYQGECRGTCPKCEAELRYLEEQLEQRRSRGKKIAVAAIAAGIIMTTTTACDFTSPHEETAGAPTAEETPAPAPTEVAEATMGEPPAEELIEEGDGALPEDHFEVEVEEGEIAVEELEGDVAYIEPEDEELMGAEATPEEIAGGIPEPTENAE